MPDWRPLRSLLLGLVLFALGACAGGGEVTSQNKKPDEIPPGPGLFSGKDGEFVIYSR